VRCGEDGKSQETCTEGDWKPTPCPAGAPICSQDQCVGIKHLALGDNHGCALFQDGHVRCWGSNTAGQLGNGQDGISYQNPATVVVGLNNAVQLAAGARHTCALLEGGTISCWGDNTRGQLGNDKDTTAYTPQPVAFKESFVQIAAGGRNTCARTADKKLWCWGDNNSQQLASFTQLYNKPTDMYFEPVDQFAVGEDFLCAKESQGVRCRGKNDWQQVGDTPSYLHTFDPFTSISELALGKNHGCIRSKHPNYNGAITCWGSSTNNKRGSFALQGQYTSAIAFTTGGNTLSLGHEHTCQIAPEPTVYVECFGDTSSYQLGNDQLILQKAVVSSVGATLLAAGSLHTCAYSPEKGLFCWGDNELGQTGSGGSGKNKFPAPVLWLS
jgi:alpha-tubulin suppressor-like RCC1 family protein